MAQALAAKDQWYVVHVLSGQENKVRDNISIEVELITPIAMEKTIRFAIREGGKTVGAGRVSEILD